MSNPIIKDAKFHTHEFTLWPDKWRACNLNNPLSWNTHAFSQASINSIPDQPGVYAFLIQPKIANLNASYLIYIGQTKRLKDRFQLFRPIGLLMVVRVIRHLVDTGVDLKSAVQRIAKVPMDLGSEPWVELLWDATNQCMITSSENQKAGVKVLFYAAGGELAILKTNEESLTKELAGIRNTEPSKIRLYRYV